MDSIPDSNTVIHGRCIMTADTILAPGCTGVVAQHSVMGVPACRMEGIIEVSRNLRMTHDTGSRNACISRGTARQGSVLIARRGHIGMTVFTSDATGMNIGDNISRAVAVCTHSRT